MGIICFCCSIDKNRSNYPWGDHVPHHAYLEKLPCFEIFSQDSYHHTVHCLKACAEGLADRNLWTKGFNSAELAIVESAQSEKSFMLKPLVRLN